MIENRVLYSSPIGLVCIHCIDDCVSKIGFVDDSSVSNTPFYSETINLAQSDTIKDCPSQLDLYFQGKLQKFNLNNSIEGTPFQKRVWDELSRIPYGSTITYKDLATRIGNPKAVRAVGGAANKNPLAIVIPCHRVIGSDGSLTGYAGGLWRKQWLLKHEMQTLNSLDNRH